jgi:hypothetical protein
MMELVRVWNRAERLPSQSGRQALGTKTSPGFWSTNHTRYRFPCQDDGLTAMHDRPAQNAVSVVGIYYWMRATCVYLGLLGN